MRPVRLSIEGLTCFKDKQEIDFRTLELFAICGPTGAGKSTLLDAMIFALYGDVPRVGNHHRKEMISASQDRARVILDFDVGAVHYRIARTLRRSGTHTVRLEQLTAEGTPKSLADQVRDATEKMEQILGLDVAAFTQAVVLPQGEFARFLKAPKAERREMLGKVLKLDVYERMREQAQRRAIDRRGKVESLGKLLAEAYVDIDDAALAALETEHAAVVGKLDGLRATREVAQADLARVQSAHARTRELRAAEGRRLELQAQAAEVDRSRGRLEGAARARPLLSLLDEAAQASGAAAIAAKATQEARIAHDAAQKEHEARAEALASVQSAADAIAPMREQIARLNQVRGRLPERARVAAAVDRQTRDLDALAGELSALEAAIAAAKALQTRQQAAVDAARRAEAEAGYDPALGAVLERVRNRAVELGAARKDAVAAAAEVARKRDAVGALAARVVPLQAKAESARTTAEAALHELQAAEEAVRHAQVLDQANHLREHLRPGEPCPVCEQLVAAPPAADLSPELERARSDLAAAQVRRRDAEALASRSEAALAAEQARLDAARHGLLEQEARCAELQASVAAGDGEIRRALGGAAPDGVPAIETWALARVVALENSRKVSDQAKARAAKAERAIAQARTDEGVAQGRLEEKQRSRQRLETERATDRERLAAIQAEIEAVTRSSDPAAEAEALEVQIRKLEQRVTAATEQATAAQHDLTTAREALRHKTEAADAARDHAARLAASRDAEIARAGFPAEQAVRAAAIDAAAIAQLELQVRRHEQESHSIDERIAALTAELGAERVSDDQLAAVRKLAEDLTGEVELKVGERTRLKETLDRTKQRLARSKELRAELETEERALRLYEHLAGDLRSDKFQAYVLLEVFTELVQGASARLRMLTRDRYSLQFTDDEIVVVDHDNAGETRISDTLSGGETFLASLALALELSEQIQRAAGAVKLDSLFIDEGFGTLDPESLEQVAATLQNLPVGGRMVGIITHIPELREEFAQQVVITKHPGFSTVKVHGLSPDLDAPRPSPER
jgi:DNA repair protein SbcC/Rad50